MKIIFVFDDQTVLVVTPEELQLRQIDERQSALGVPAGKNEQNEELFRPIITYPAILTIIPKPEPPAVVADAPVTAPEPTGVSKKKKVPAKKVTIQ